MISKATPETVLIIKFRKRSVALLRDKCFTYEGTLSTLKSTFLSLKDVPDEEIVLLSTLPDCQWDGLIEISPDTWKELKKCVSHVTVVLKAERASLEDNNNNNNNTTTTTTTTTTPGIPSLFSPRNAEARSSFVQTLPFKFPTQPK